MNYRVSNFAKILKKSNDEVIFFNSNTLDLLHGGTEELEKLNEFKTPQALYEDPIIKVFLKKKFLLPEEYNEYDKAKKYRKLRREKAKDLSEDTIGYLRISLTENCNLQCKYCFVNDIFKDKKKNNMDLETFTETMDWFVSQNKGRDLIVQYFGGEPLLRMDLIKKGHEMLKKVKEEGAINTFTEEIVTNGTIIDKEMASYFAKNNFTINFSIDGWKEINDKNRVYPNGNGSYDMLMNGVNNFKEAGGSLSAIMTPTNDNIDKFYEIVKFLVEEIGFNEISVNTPQPTIEGWDIDGNLFAEAMSKIWAYCDENNVPINHPGNNIVFLVNNKLPQTYSCMNLTYGQGINTWGIYVTSEGRISKCVVECDERCTCDFEEFQMDREYIDWHYIDNSTNKCLNCIAYNVCGGPCSIEAVLMKGKLNEDKCKFYNKLMPWVLKK